MSPDSNREAYDIVEHIHIFASWAASRAASTSKLNRFKVELGQGILNKSGLKAFILNPDALPDDQTKFDELHRKCRTAIVKREPGNKFTHGVAAKLINVYLKTIIICGGFHEHPKARFIHPPIDAVLLKALADTNFGGKTDFWREARTTAWSKFDSDEYEKVIKAIHDGLNGKPLWTIEEYWKGYQ